MLYLGDVAGTGETKRHRADRFGHEAHGYLIPTIPHRLDGLADVPVVMSHADVLRTAERQGGTGDEDGVEAQGAVFRVK